MLSQLREEYERRGDFNRIFPAEETWSQYGDFVDSLYTSLHSTSTPAANFNRMVHEQVNSSSSGYHRNGYRSSSVWLSVAEDLCPTPQTNRASMMNNGRGGRGIWVKSALDSS